MKNINAAQLAFIMQIPKKDAIGKINKIHLDKGVREEELDEKNPTTTVKEMSERLGINLDFFIEDIGKNFLKNQATGSYILNFPTTKLKPSKTTGLMPKVISIPSVLRSFLPKEIQEEIRNKWNEKYEKEVKEYDIIFK
jgi:hypothetical protein